MAFKPQTEMSRIKGYIPVQGTSMISRTLVLGGAWARDPLTRFIAHDEALLQHLGEDAFGHVIRLWLGL